MCSWSRWRRVRYRGYHVLSTGVATFILRQNGQLSPDGRPSRPRHPGKRLDGYICYPNQRTALPSIPTAIARRQDGAPKQARPNRPPGLCSTALPRGGGHEPRTQLTSPAERRMAPVDRPIHPKCLRRPAATAVCWLAISAAHWCSNRAWAFATALTMAARGWHRRFHGNRTQGEALGVSSRYRKVVSENGQVSRRRGTVAARGASAGLATKPRAATVSRAHSAYGVIVGRLAVVALPVDERWVESRQYRRATRDPLMGLRLACTAAQRPYGRADCGSTTPPALTDVRSKGCRGCLRAAAHLRLSSDPRRPVDPIRHGQPRPLFRNDDADTLRALILRGSTRHRKAHGRRDRQRAEPAGENGCPPSGYPETRHACYGLGSRFR